MDGKGIILQIDQNLISMTNFLISIFVLVVGCNIINGQSATALPTFGQYNDTDPSLQSPVNPWLGAQVGYMYGDKEFT